MRPQLAIQKLQELKAEAENPTRLYQAADEGSAWKSKVRGVIARALGNKHDLVQKLDDNRYGLSMWTENTPSSAWMSAFAGGVKTAVGYVDAAIYELELLTGDDDPIDEGAYDVELWDHVKGLVDSEECDKISSVVVTFVEDRVRTWGDFDTDKYGKGLYAAALGDAGELRLGKSKGEWEGWRALGMGFAQAVGNVDRHRLQRRDDARRYAIGVLGLGSLLLVQMRHKHGDLIEDRDDPQV